MTAAPLQGISVRSRQHVVQFYEHDDELERVVGRYLASAIHDGAVAITIATESRVAGFQTELTAAGLDAAACIADGRLIVLDAATTLAAFSDQGTIDTERFHRIVGSVVRGAVDKGKPVCAFGEMVALLWERGDVPGVVELEKAWNHLASQVPFMLICAYRSEAVQDFDLAGAAAEVCSLHTTVFGAPSSTAKGARMLVAEFPAEAEAPRDARHFVTDALERWGHDGSLLDDARLVVTELATNAVVHAASQFSLRLRVETDGVRLEVRDASHEHPVMGAPALDATSGRGLPVVAAASVAWGVDDDAIGKTVWAELRA